MANIVSFNGGKNNPFADVSLRLKINTIYQGHEKGLDLTIQQAVAEGMNIPNCGDESKDYENINGLALIANRVGPLADLLSVAWSHSESNVSIDQATPSTISVGWYYNSAEYAEESLVAPPTISILGLVGADGAPSEDVSGLDEEVSVVPVSVETERYLFNVGAVFERLNMLTRCSDLRLTKVSNRKDHTGSYTDVWYTLPRLRQYELHVCVSVNSEYGIVKTTKTKEEE